MGAAHCFTAWHTAPNLILCSTTTTVTRFHYWICFVLLESLKDLFRVFALAHDNPVATLLYLHSQEIAQFARRNSEVTMQLINKHIDLTFITPRDQAVVEIDGDN
jgi:hypothetical protein